jgi:hypothetical protein
VMGAFRKHRWALLAALSLLLGCGTDVAGTSAKYLDTCLLGGWFAPPNLPLGSPNTAQVSLIPPRKTERFPPYPIPGRFFCV